MDFVAEAAAAEVRAEASKAAAERALAVSAQKARELAAAGFAELKAALQKQAG